MSPDLCRPRGPWFLLADEFGCDECARLVRVLSRMNRWQISPKSARIHLRNSGKDSGSPQEKIMESLTQISNTSLVGAEQPATVLAPEIEKGVGCDFDSYLLVPDNRLDERIAAAKEKLGKDVVILGHHYQRDEVVKFADFRGDSLKLSQQAAAAN